MMVGLLLAAGRSRRFGDTDKLLAPLRGRAVLDHAADTMRRLPLDARFAVTASPDVEDRLADFRVVRNDAPEAGQGESLALGAAAARAWGATRLLVMLGDMPFVTVDHCLEVLARCAPERAAASRRGAAPLPPAAFPLRDIRALQRIDGDRGARTLIRSLPEAGLVAAPAAELEDIDTPASLELAGS